MLLAGCSGSRLSAESRGAADAKPQAKATPAPEAQIIRDEAMLKKPHAIIGGAVQNVSSGTLENLSVEIELKRRADGSVERRDVSVVPDSLAPGEQGRYALKVLSDEWGAFNVVGLRSASREHPEVAFKILPGAKRPPERMPESKVVVVKTPRPKRQGGEEFINTPDTPISVP